MTVNAKNKTLGDVFPGWVFTPDGSFRNKDDGRILSRKDWEIEVSYEHMNDPEKLAFAKEIVGRASKMANPSA